jgi:uncharacterized DUF497 family protein
MRFTWDEEKRKRNLQKHGIDFRDAAAVFSGPTFTIEDDRFDYQEERFITLGLLRGIVAVIAHTEQSDTIHVISMRKATRHEQKLYFQGFVTD